MGCPTAAGYNQLDLPFLRVNRFTCVFQQIYQCSSHTDGIHIYPNLRTLIVDRNSRNQGVCRHAGERQAQKPLCRDQGHSVLIENFRNHLSHPVTRIHNPPLIFGQFWILYQLLRKSSQPLNGGKRGLEVMDQILYLPKRPHFNIFHSSLVELQLILFCLSVGLNQMLLFQIQKPH